MLSLVSAFLLLVVLITPLHSIALTAYSSYHQRDATLAELKERYTPHDLCIIALLASANNSHVPAARAQELQEFLSLPHCVGENLATVWAYAKHNKGPGISGSNSFSPDRKAPLQLSNASNKCGVSHVDMVSFWTSAWDIPQEPLTPAAALLETLTSHNFKYLLNLGDSVSEQLHAAMYFNWRSAIGLNVRHYIPCGLKKIGVKARSAQTCPTTDNRLCTDELQADFVQSVVASVIEQTYKNASTVILFMPFGAHIWDVDLHTKKGIAMGIIQGAKEAIRRNSLLLVLESPSQGFAYDYDPQLNAIPDMGRGMGMYRQNSRFYRGNVPGPCCMPPTNYEEGNFRNFVLLGALDEVDPNWRDYVGWVQFYNLTTVQGAHVDHGMDCTHISWSPFLLDPLWIDLRLEIERLFPLLGGE